MYITCKFSNLPVLFTSKLISAYHDEFLRYLWGDSQFVTILSYELKCGEGIVGDSVTIINKKTHLTLCEVKVYGDDTPITG